MNYKHNRKTIEITCDGCEIIFNKTKKDYDRNIRIGRKSYCTRSCAGKHNINTRLLNTNNRENEFTPYKYYMKVVRQRDKEYNITLEDLQIQWIAQKGICPYSGVQLILSTHSKQIKDPIHAASLDRTDSAEGYIKGNIQFTSKAMNYMKGEMSHQETLNLCKIIANHYK